MLVDSLVEYLLAEKLQEDSASSERAVRDLANAIKFFRRPLQDLLDELEYCDGEEDDHLIGQMKTLTVVLKDALSKTTSVTGGLSSSKNGSFR